MKKSKTTLLILCLGLLSLFSLLVSISFGSSLLSEKTVIAALWHHGSEINQTIILQLRLPRGINAFVTGGLLALAGTLMQALLRNPLADPYILGISGGSSVAALIAILLGATSFGLSSVTLLGGLLAMIIVWGLNYRAHHWQTNHLLLTGVVFAAGCNAITTLVLTLSPNNLLRSMMFWLVGEINTGPLVRWPIFVLVLSFAICLKLSQPLDLLNHGELKAKTLGVNTRLLTLILYVLSAILTASAVSIAGPIGFVGLITPHIIRLLGFYRHQVLLPASVLLGGSLLCFADTLSRTIIAPEQLPVGAITAVIGVPVFLLLLKSGKKRII